MNRDDQGRAARPGRTSKGSRSEVAVEPPPLPNDEADVVLDPFEFVLPVSSGESSGPSDSASPSPARGIFSALLADRPSAEAGRARARDALVSEGHGTHAIAPGVESPGVDVNASDLESSSGFEAESSELEIDSSELEVEAAALRPSASASKSIVDAEGRSVALLEAAVGEARALSTSAASVRDASLAAVVPSKALPPPSVSQSVSAAVLDPLVPAHVARAPRSRTDLGAAPPQTIESEPSVASRWKERLSARFEALMRSRPSDRVMIGAFVSFGAVSVALWSALASSDVSHLARGAASRTPLTDPRGFPKIPVEGLPTLAEDEVRRVLERPPASLAEPPSMGLAAAAAGPETARAPATTPEGRTVLAPGMLVDSDGAGVVVLGPNGEGTERLVRTRAGGGRSIEGGAGPAPVVSEGVASESSPMRPGPSASRPAGHTGELIEAEFYSPGGFLEVAPEKRKSISGADPVPLAVGERFKVRLEIGIASSTRLDVLGSVADDVFRSGRRVLKKGDMLKGRFTCDDTRVFVEFRSVVSAGRTFSLVATAVEGQMPGLRARRREATVEERSRAKVASGALEGAAREAGSVLAQAAGAPGRIAERVAGDAVAEATEELVPDSTWVLEVAAGRVFELVVTGTGP